MSVTDKSEFLERAVRHGMIWPSTAEKIIKRKGIELQPRIESRNNAIESITIDEFFILSQTSITINGEIFMWADIKDLRITGNISGYSGSIIMLIFNDNRFIRQELRLSDPKHTEFLIDKYLHRQEKQFPDQTITPTDYLP